jgi:hypothetical protein
MMMMMTTTIMMMTIIIMTMVVAIIVNVESGSHSSVAEDPSHVGHDNVSLGKYTLHFEAWCSLRNVGTPHPMTECHIAQDLNLQ